MKNVNFKMILENDCYFSFFILSHFHVVKYATHLLHHRLVVILGSTLWLMLRC